MNKSDFTPAFESSQLFLLDAAQPGLALLEQSPEMPSRDAMIRVIDDIREHMYFHAGQVFANLESLAHAARINADEDGELKYLAVLTGGALAYASTWLQIGEETQELPEPVAQKHILWSPEQISTLEDLSWSGRAMSIGRQEWNRDPALRALVTKHAQPTVGESEQQVCYDAAGYTKYSVAVARLYADRQDAWIARQIADLELGNS
jgi:hypothetical protein